MKITTKAHELSSADVEHISLVKHGANRIPFRILKSEDAIEGASFLKGLMNFAKDEEAKVTSVVIRKDTDEDQVALVKSLGIDISETEEVGDLIVYKQEGFDENATLFAITEDIAVGVSGVEKSFAPSITDDFNENLKGNSFFPSLYTATDMLMMTIHKTMDDGDQSSASGGIDKALAAYTKYVKSLVKGLPEMVFKMEQGLRQEFERSTMESTVEKSTTEDQDMSKIPEAMAGDLDGLNNDLEKQDAAQAAAPAEDAPVEKTEEKAEDKPVEKTDETEGGEKQVEKSEDKPAEEEGEKQDEEVDPLKMMANTLQTMTQTLLGLQKSVEDQGKRLEAVEKAAGDAANTAEEALEKTEKTVVMTLNDIDESLSGLTRRRDVQKSAEPTPAEDDLWKGVMPQLENLASGE